MQIIESVVLYLPCSRCGARTLTKLMTNSPAPQRALCTSCDGIRTFMPERVAFLVKEAREAGTITKEVRTAICTCNNCGGKPVDLDKAEVVA